MPVLDKLLEPGKVLAGALPVPLPPMVWAPEKSHLDHWWVKAQAVVLSIPSQRPGPHFAAAYAGNVIYRLGVFSLGGNAHTHTRAAVLPEIFAEQNFCG